MQGAMDGMKSESCTERPCSPLSLASDAGHLLLENGAEISRVEETMERIAGHYGETREHFFVLSNGIFTTGDDFSKVEYIPMKAARLDMVSEVNQLTRDIVSHDMSLDEASRRLDCIRKIPSKPLWEQVVGAMLGCFGFGAIFGGSMADCLASALTGLIAFVAFIGCYRVMSKPLANICAGLAGVIVCVLLMYSGAGIHLGNNIVGTIIVLIPGVAFTNGLRDVANEDYLAGTTKLLDALMVFFCIAMGVCLVFISDALLNGEMIQLHGTVTDSWTYHLPVQLVMAFIGTAAFAVLFGVPRRNYLMCGVVGMTGWLVYLLFVRYTSLSVAGGTFFATLCVTFLSRFSAKRFKTPSTIFLICGIFPLIPGAGVFWSSYYLVSEQFGMAANAGFTAFKVTVAIVLGINIALNIIKPKRKKRKAS